MRTIGPVVGNRFRRIGELCVVLHNRIGLALVGADRIGVIGRGTSRTELRACCQRERGDGTPVWGCVLLDFAVHMQWLPLRGIVE